MCLSVDRWIDVCACACVCVRETVAIKRRACANYRADGGMFATGHGSGSICHHLSGQ